MNGGLTSVTIASRGASEPGLGLGALRVREECPWASWDNGLNVLGNVGISRKELSKSCSLTRGALHKNAQVMAEAPGGGGLAGWHL